MRARPVQSVAVVHPGPANLVTAVRGAFVIAVAVLVAGEGRVALVVALAVATIVLDGVDGHVARRTGTESAFGAAFDMEVDALLILVLSLAVAPSVGAWVLLIGAARYLLGAATLVLPWLRRPVPVRWWAKAVAVFQGVALTVAVSGVLAPTAVRLLLLVALGLLAESFWHQVRWLARHRTAAP